MGVVKYAIVGFIVLTVLYLILANVFSVENYPTVNLENRSFVANNTDYSLAHTPTTEIGTFKLYYFANTTYEIPSALYARSGASIRVYSNGTTAYPNVTNGTSTFYYASYRYEKSETVMGVDFSFIIIIGLVMLIAIFAYEYFVNPR